MFACLLALTSLLITSQAYPMELAEGIPHLNANAPTGMDGPPPPSPAQYPLGSGVDMGDVATSSHQRFPWPQNSTTPVMYVDMISVMDDGDREEDAPGGVTYQPLALPPAQAGPLVLFAQGGEETEEIDLRDYDEGGRPYGPHWWRVVSHAPPWNLPLPPILPARNGIHPCNKAGMVRGTWRGL